MSDSVRPHRRQPTRLPCLWDSPGKNTGVGCHFLLQCMKVKSQSEVAQSCPTLSDPMDYSLPGSSVHGIFQARVLEWVDIAFLWDWSGSLSFPVLWPLLSFQISWYIECRTFTASCFTTTYCAPWRRQWHPTPVLLPGKSHGWRSLVGCSPQGHRVGHNWATALSLSLLMPHLS